MIIKTSQMWHKNAHILIVLLFGTFQVQGSWLQWSSNRIKQPPMIIKQPTTDEILYQVANSSSENIKPFLIECEADGEPKPSYRWTKNGQPFALQEYDSHISQQFGSGPLIITNPRDEDSGIYQCFAENEHGIATSNVVHVRKAVLNSFDDDLPSYVTAIEGDPLKLQCQPPNGWPKPIIHWVIQDLNDNIKMINDSRITVDPEGDLHFSNVTREDALDNNFYVCVVTSTFNNEYHLGSRVLLEVEKPRLLLTPNRQKPTLLYGTNENETALLGKRIELFCIFGGTPLPQITWNKDGQPIDSDERIKHGNYGKSVIIRDISYNDAGTYTCQASNGVEDVESHSINLKVNAEPYFIIQPEIQIAAEDESAEFKCEAAGVPQPEIKWIFNGKPISDAPSNPRRTITANKITITNLKSTDTGNYGCNATNSLGYIYKDVYLNVLALPAGITESPRKEASVEGQNVTMRCRVFGAPAPKLKWIRNGVELSGDHYNVQPSGDLIIQNVSFSDAGRYTCHAENTNGQSEATGALTVKKRTQIIEKPEDYEVAAGNSATFRCNAEGDASLNLNIKWLFNGEEIDFDNEPRFWLRTDNSLYISRVNEFDFGVYTCVASTELDEVSANATLIVQDVPLAPRLTGVSCYGQEAFISWKPVGIQNRAPILHYTVEYSTFKSNNWNVHEYVPAIYFNSHIPIRPWRNYTFRVIATNKIGSSAPSNPSESCITQPDVPHKNPENVKGEGTTSTNLVISWTPIPEIEHNGPRFHYRVFWKRDNPDFISWNIHNVYDWRQDKIVIKNQPTFVRYRIKVIAINQLGESNAVANEVFGYSGEAQPTQAPTNLTLDRIVNGTSAILSWNPISSDAISGHFKGYKIQIWNEYDGEENLQEILVKDNTNETLVTKFQPDAINYARILAFNRFDGVASDIIDFKTPQKDPSPRGVQSLEAIPLRSTAFLLRWKKPLKIKGQLTGYRIYYEEISGSTIKKRLERDPQIDDPLVNQTMLSGLKPNTKYRFHVIPVTKFTEGEDFYIETKTPQEDAKSVKPNSPNFTWEQLPSTDDDGIIRIKWLPSVNGKLGTHFFVKYRRIGDPLWKETDYVLEDDIVEIGELQKYAEYEFAVVSVDGEYMTESETQTIYVN